MRPINFTHAQIIWSLAYWGIWVLVLFLAPEILGSDRIAPWVTLSETVWWVEHGRALLANLIFTSVIGIALHWRFGTRLGRTEAIAAGIALLMYATRFL